MVLGFKQFFDPQKTQPTYFREKILAGVGRSWNQTPDGQVYILKDNNLIPSNNLYKPKLHTIRAGNRFTAGDLIHMAYGVRTKDYCQFNKGIPELERVRSVQKIKIVIDKYSLQQIYIDGRHFNFHSSFEKLVINDGFSGLGQFWSWFNKDFEGQIVHWSELKY